MKTNLHSILNLQSFYDFVKLSKTQKEELLITEGVFLDLDNEKDLVTRLFFLKGFFVEEIFCRSLNEVMDIIPYKQGYRIESYLKTETCSLSDRPYYFQYCTN